MSTEFALQKILSCLSNEKFCSLAELESELNISSHVIAKHIESLQVSGTAIRFVAGKGYQMSLADDLLDQQNIIHNLKKYASAGSVDVLSVVGSTNDYFRQGNRNFSSGDTVLAEMQTAGRGRQGKTWLSPYAANIYLSMYWQFSNGVEQLSGLSLAAGTAVAESLESTQINHVMLKWPNDIYADGKKLGGILVELEGNHRDICIAIIGIGLNVHMPSDLSIDQPWTAINRLGSKSCDRNRLSASLIATLRNKLKEFEQYGFARFVEPWEKRNLFSQQLVDIKSAGKTLLSGKCIGVDENGGIKILTVAGTKTYYSGEISLRKSV